MGREKKKNIRERPGINMPFSYPSMMPKSLHDANQNYNILQTQNLLIPPDNLKQISCYQTLQPLLNTLNGITPTPRHICLSNRPKTLFNARINLKPGSEDCLIQQKNKKN